MSIDITLKNNRSQRTDVSREQAITGKLKICGLGFGEFAELVLDFLE